MTGFSRRFLTAGLLCAPALFIRDADAAEPAGKVEQVIGTGSAESGGRTRGLSSRDDIFLGDMILTGTASRLSMKLGTDTNLRLGETTRVRIDRYLVGAGGTIELLGGPLLIEKAKTAKPLAVRSPFGLITVRGTKLFAGPSNGVFGVFVSEGVVSVSNLGQSVSVHAGLGTNLAAGMHPTKPVKWGDARIQAALASVS